MALDFPSSPTNGQTYGNYYYDATVGAWNSFSSTVNTIPSTLKNLSVTTDDIGNAPLTIKSSTGSSVASISNDGTITATALSLTNDLTVANGGTGAGTFTTGAYLKGNGTSAIQAQTGIPFADVTIQSIGSGADLDTYISQGLYHQNANVNAAGGVNYPAPYAGLLEVFTADAGNFIYQRYTTYKEQLAAYTRAKYATTWSAWQREGTQAEVVALVPAGTVTQTARATAPTGWLLCDGTAVSRTTYANLFTAIGTNYGTGDGSTTFNLPNLKGKVPVGRDAADTSFDVLGETGGAKTHTLTIAEMPSHTHIQDSHNHTQNAHGHNINEAWSDANVTHNHGSSAGYVAQGQSISRGGTYSDPNAIVATTATNNATTATNQNTGGGGAHNNLQPYIVLNYMIKV